MQGYSLLESYDHYNVISAFCNRKNKTVSKAKKDLLSFSGSVSVPKESKLRDSIIYALNHSVQRADRFPMVNLRVQTDQLGPPCLLLFLLVN